MGDTDEATAAYSTALRANPRSIPAMNGMSNILRASNQFNKAIDYLQNILKLDQSNGEVWGSLGACPSRLFPAPLTVCRSLLPDGG